MLPTFKRAGNGYMCATVGLSLHPECECGRVASVLATFRVKLPPSSLDTKRKHSGLAALMLCSECAVEMLEVDILWHEMNHQAEWTHYMGVLDARRMAKETESPCDGPQKGKQRKPNSKWGKILAWMAGQNKPFYASEIIQKFNMPSENVTSQLWAMTGRGYLKMEKGNNGRNRYTVVHVPDGVGE